MTYAIITLKPLSIVEEFAQRPLRVILPTGDQVEGVSVGWSNDEHMLAEVRRNGTRPTPFHRPVDGKISRSGSVVTIRMDYEPQLLTEVQATLVDQIKGEAGARITAIVPEWKQRNLLAQAAQLLHKGRANWSDAERGAWSEGHAVWERVDAIRAASDRAEAAVSDASITTVEAAWVKFQSIEWPQ